jgi:hypothetical protein
VRRARSLYQALLRCYPSAFRNEYGGQMLLMFTDQLREARQRGSAVESAVLWSRALRDALIVAPREHGHLLAQDLRCGWRAVAARPGFAIAAVLSLDVPARRASRLDPIVALRQA